MAVLKIEMQGYSTKPGLFSLHQDSAEPTLARSMEGKQIILDLKTATFTFRIFDTKQLHLACVH